MSAIFLKNCPFSVSNKADVDEDMTSPDTKTPNIDDNDAIKRPLSTACPQKGKNFGDQLVDKRRSKRELKSPQFLKVKFKRSKSKRKKKAVVRLCWIKLYCSCEVLETTLALGCNFCNEWYHIDCLDTEFPVTEARAREIVQDNTLCQTCNNTNANLCLSRLPSNFKQQKSCTYKAPNALELERHMMKPHIAKRLSLNSNEKQHMTVNDDTTSPIKELSIIVEKLDGENIKGHDVKLEKEFKSEKKDYGACKMLKNI